MLGIIMMFMLISVSGYAANAERKTAVATYGTPVVDGKIDSVWNNANYYTVNNCNKTGGELYKGWFKVMWDEENIYVLAKVYSTQLDDSHSSAWYHDSIDVYIDENCGRTKPYEEDDYQIRTNFNGVISGNNYFDFKKVKAGTGRFDNGFIAEMSFPLYTITPKEGLTVGFEVLMTASQTIGIEMREYLWNTKSNWLYNDTNCYGNLKLAKKVDVLPFDEPEWIPPVVTRGYSDEDAPDLYETVNGVTAKFDSLTYDNVTVVLANDYPCLAVEDFARILGGTSKDGNTIIKDNSEVKFTEGSLLAEDKNGHLIIDRVPFVCGGKLYVPASYVMPSLTYTMHYNRFDKILEIKTGTDYPQEAEVVIYAKDYGAVGDGVHDDAKAILHAINAAINSGKPSRVELERDKTYLVSGRPDHIAYIYLDGVENFTLEGNGSELLFEAPTNNFIDIENCANIHIRNLEVDYKELTFTQGRAKSIDAENRVFTLTIDEGYPLPPSDEWVKYYYKNAGNGGWWFTQIMDPIEPRLKYGVTHYDIFIDSVKHISGRDYEVTIANGYQNKLAEADVGDRFVLNTRTSLYDVGDWTHNGLLHGMIEILYSGDIYIENVNVYCSPWHGVNAGLNWGQIHLDGYGMKTKDGRLMSANSDGIHYWRNREGLILENSVLMNNLDDHVNTKGESGYINKAIDKYTFDVDNDQMYRVGDEIIFVDQVNNDIIGRAFLKSCTKQSDSSYILEVDRPIEDVIDVTMVSNKWDSTIVYNLNCIGQGSIYRNNVFKYSRRYGVLSRSRNSIFEGNLVYENGGSGLRASDEKRTARWEGAYPSCFTMRNNEIIAPDCLPPDYPVLVEANRATPGSSASIEGFLMENNTIKTNVLRSAIYIKFVKGLYMINNTIISDKPLKEGIHPVVIENSRIDLIDGINFDYVQNVDAVVTISGSKVDEANIKNININEGNTAKPYVIQ